MPTPESTSQPTPAAPPEATWLPSLSPRASAPPVDTGGDLGDLGWFQVATRGDGPANILFVGRLDGRAFQVMTNEKGWIHGSGPRAGKALAWWEDEGETVFLLVDTADGSSKEVMRVPDPVSYGASLDPSGRFIYWSPAGAKGHIRGLYRRPIEGGETEKVLDGWDADIAVMTWSLDGRWLSISDVDGPQSDYRILDALDGQLHVHRDSGVGDVIGFLGDRLVGYLARGDGGNIEYPLLGLDSLTGDIATLVKGDGTFAAIVPDVDGKALLVYDAPDADGAYTLRVLDDAGQSRQLHVGDDPWLEATFGEGATSQMVRPNWWQGVEAPGWIGVFPRGFAYPWPEVSKGLGDTRILIALDDGSALQVPGPEVEEPR